jgi:GntR family transcriptional regulator/MocR family aminotransferase
MSKEQLFFLDRNSELTLQQQLQELMVDAILNGHMSCDQPLPSSRKLANNLGISRNTVVLVFENLLSDGFLTSRERSGYYVNPAVFYECEKNRTKQLSPSGFKSKPNWQTLFKKTPSSQHNIEKPTNWQSFTYPFIYGQLDHLMFPIGAWRQCSKQAQDIKAVKKWSMDSFTSDNPDLIEKIRTRLLTRRGVRVTADEVLLTMGTQHALYLITSLLMEMGTKVGIENPGYVDARNNFALKTDHLVALPVDKSGLKIGNQLNDCDFIYTTPSHQYPTGVTMTLERRLRLLKRAEEKNFIVIEDDYESEINHLRRAIPALKSLDSNERVIYMSSFSKSLASGLRLGFLIGSKDLITEARALRRLMLRHPPANIQRTVESFISRGNYNSLMLRRRKIYKERWEIMGQAIKEYLPTCCCTPNAGGSSFWIAGPDQLNAKDLESLAQTHSILIESGDLFFMEKTPPHNFFRLGFSSIPTYKIKPGIKLLGELLLQLI